MKSEEIGFSEARGTQLCREYPPSYLQSSKMDDAINIGVLLKNPIKRLFIRDVDIVECGPLAADKFDAIDGLFGRVVEIVSDDNFISFFQQRKRRE